MRKALFLFLLSSISCAALAQTTVPHAFSAGTPAKASEVNNNFNALSAAINALAARLDVLEGKDSAFTVSAMAGTYKLLNIYSGAQQDGGQFFVHSSTQDGTLILNTNGTYTFNTSEKNSNTRVFVAGDPPQIASSNSVTTDTGSINGTWSVAEKKLTLSGISTSYTIAAGNRVLISTVRSDSSPAYLGIDMLVRQ